MNKKTLSILIILTGLLGMLAFACEEENPAVSGDTLSSEDAIPSEDAISSGDAIPSENSAQNIGEKTPAGAAIMEVYGMLEWSESEGLTLVDGQDSYELKNDSDLSNFIGKQVKVTGTLATDGSDRFIQVVKVVETPSHLTEQTK